MSLTIVLDTGPQGLLVQRPGVAQADTCRAWLDRHLTGGHRAVVPEVADYELRRELIRLGLHPSVARLGQICAAPNVEFLPLRTPAMRSPRSSGRRQGG